MRLAPSLLDLSLSPSALLCLLSSLSINQTTYGYDILNDKINLLQKIMDNKRVS